MTEQRKLVRFDSNQVGVSHDPEAEWPKDDIFRFGF
jgi:hypothetical protein